MLVFALSVVASGWVSFHTPIRLSETAQNWWNLSGILGASFIPFVLGGLVVAHVLAFNAERAHRLYCYDLFGAGCACIVFVPLIRWSGAPSALLGAAGMGVVGGAFLARDRRAVVALALASALLFGAAHLNRTRGFFDLVFAKGAPTSASLVTRWNAFSRVEVRGVPGDMLRRRPPVSWGFSSTLRASVPELHLLYDADALTQIPGFNGQLESVRYLLYDVTSAAHHVRVNPDVLVIGAGGGRDILAALAAGSRAVTGVEINDVTVDLMRGRFKDYTGRLYVSHPGVEVVVEDGRSFVQHAPRRYDLIQASLVDTWAASSAGAYALAENSLYTVEAFADYLSRLKPDGLVSFSRWYGTPPVEVMRLVVLACRALAGQGIRQPFQHLAIVRTDSRLTHRPSLATIMLKRSPFTDTELKSLSDWAHAMRFRVALLPMPGGISSSEPLFAQLLGSDAQLASLIETAPFDLSATTDDRPFFFDRVPLVGWVKHRLGLSAPAYSRGELPLASRTLLFASAATCLNALLLMMLPLLRLGSRSRERDALSLARRLAWVSYFACLGIGYIVVEIVLIQRLNLYLGNPAYALTVVLFTMLVSSGAGSLFARRWDHLRALIPMVLSVSIAVVWMRGSIDLVVHTTLAAPTAIRIAIVVLYVAPLGLLMGMPFPTGLRHASRQSESLVPWAWAVNGGMSVLGTVVAVIVSMTGGFSTSLALGALAYVAALLIVTMLVRSSGASVPAG